MSSIHRFEFGHSGVCYWVTIYAAGGLLLQPDLIIVKIRCSNYQLNSTGSVVGISVSCSYSTSIHGPSDKIMSLVEDLKGTGHALL
jgi:hypothetical protein